MCGPFCGLCCMRQQNECRPGRLGKAVTQAELAWFGDIHPLQVSRVPKALNGMAWWPGRETNWMFGPSTWRLPGPAWRRFAARCRSPSMCSSACSAKGRPGGNLLTALLSLDSEHSEATKPASLNAEQDPDHR